MAGTNAAAPARSTNARSCAADIASGTGRWVQMREEPPSYAAACAPLARLLFGSTLRLCELETPPGPASTARLFDQTQRVQRSASFRWQPSTPACGQAPPGLARVDAARFAALLAGGRRLVVLGDSLSKQFAIALVCNLLPAVDDAATRQLRAGSADVPTQGLEPTASEWRHPTASLSPHSRSPVTRAPW